MKRNKSKMHDCFRTISIILQFVHLSANICIGALQTHKHTHYF